MFRIAVSEIKKSHDYAMGIGLKMIGSLIKNSRGFSLVEIIIGMGLASAVGLSTGYLMLNQASVQLNSNRQLDLSDHHNLVVQHARNFNYISKHLVLGSTGGRNVALDSCLVSRPNPGVNCEAFNVPVTSILPTPVSALSSPDGATTDSVVTGGLECSTAGCRVISIRIVTTQVKGSAEIARRESAATYPGQSFAPIGQIDFSCVTSGSILTGINLANRVATCAPIVSGTSCSNQGPMRVFGTSLNCQPLENKSCASGVASVGIFSGQTQCASVATTYAGAGGPAAQDCVGSWQACSASCGTGTQTYAISQPATGGGASCEALPGATRACSGLPVCPTPTPVTGATPSPTPAPDCNNQYSVYFGWTCPGPTENLSFTCPSGQGTPQAYYGTHAAPAVCNRMPNTSDFGGECRPCTTAPTNPPPATPVTQCWQREDAVTTMIGGCDTVINYFNSLAACGGRPAGGGCGNLNSACSESSTCPSGPPGPAEVICPSGAAVSWVSGTGASCSATTRHALAGSTISVDSTAPSTLGTATVTCSASGNWEPAVGSSCVNMGPTPPSGPSGACPANHCCIRHPMMWFGTSTPSGTPICFEYPNPPPGTFTSDPVPMAAGEERRYQAGACNVGPCHGELTIKCDGASGGISYVDSKCFDGAEP